MKKELSDDARALETYYSHTSRVFNAATTLMLAGMAFFIAILNPVKDLEINPILDIRPIILFIIFLAITYDIVRIVELNLQLQYLEYNILYKECNLHQFVNENLPRWKIHKRSSEEEMINFPHGKQSTLQIIKQFSGIHWLTLIFWIVISIFGEINLLSKPTELISNQILYSFIFIVIMLIFLGILVYKQII